MKTQKKALMPTTTTSFVLHLLINCGAISERATKLNGYRHIISVIELKHGIKLVEKHIKFVNDYGRKCYYKTHQIAPGFMVAAKKLFKEMISKNA
jgi:hypothetical protein